MKRGISFIFVAPALAGMGLAAGATAADFDGSKPLLCAPAEAQHCMSGWGCEAVTVEELNLPRFVRIDFRGKRLYGTVPGGGVEETPIQDVRYVAGRTLLQGGEEGRGWSVVIDQASGMMSAAIAMTDGSDSLSASLFGACTPD